MTLNKTDEKHEYVNKVWCDNCGQEMLSVFDDLGEYHLCEECGEEKGEV